MTTQKAREHFGLRPEDKVDVASTRDLLEKDERLLQGWLSKDMREQIEQDVMTLRVLLEQRGSDRLKLTINTTQEE